MFNHLPFAIPARLLRQTDSLLAFRHPRPAYPFHVLILPKAAIRSLMDVPSGDPFLADLILAVQSLVCEHDLKAYRLVVNGGEYQEFPHLHFHLISE